MEISTVVILAIAFLGLFYLVAIYNRLVALRNRFRNAFAQIEVQLKRRHDLIPNLVEIAKGYLGHERETLEAVVAARQGAVAELARAAANPANAAAITGLGQAEGTLTGALGRLNLVVEAYPNLKADTNLRQLHEELASTENKVAFARQSFNDEVMAYNTYRQSFPQHLLAGLFGHGTDASWLEFADSAAIQQAPRVSF
jgi:LemA protein